MIYLPEYFFVEARVIMNVIFHFAIGNINNGIEHVEQKLKNIYAEQKVKGKYNGQKIYVLTA